MSTNPQVIIRAPGDIETVRDIEHILDPNTSQTIFVEKAERRIEISKHLQELISECLERLLEESKFNEKEEIQRLKEFLDGSVSKITFMKCGKRLEIPDAIHESLCQVMNAMASGQVFHLIPYDHHMTSQQAADFLNVSRPYLVKLLDQKIIPSIKVGAHRRVHVEDLINYKRQRDEQRTTLLAELAELHQSEGGYEQ